MKSSKGASKVRCLRSIVAVLLISVAAVNVAAEEKLT
ncbi:MAG: hypothetical protein LAO06_03080 [Acidobacteriia bacterium]|nr:hypothetical protein [Terriglobia bacterium]